MEIEISAQSLNEFVLRQDAKTAAIIFSKLLKNNNRFSLDTENQIALANLLFRHESIKLAIKAWENLEEHCPDSDTVSAEIYNAAIRCYNYPGLEFESLRFFKIFLKSNPKGNQFQQAIKLYIDLQKRISAGLPKKDIEDLHYKTDIPVRIGKKSQQPQPMTDFEVNISSETPNPPEEIPLIDLNYYEKSDVDDKLISSPVQYKPDTGSHSILKNNKFGKILASDTSELEMKIMKKEKADKLLQAQQPQPKESQRVSDKLKIDQLFESPEMVAKNINIAEPVQKNFNNNEQQKQTSGTSLEYSDNDISINDAIFKNDENNVQQYKITVKKPFHEPQIIDNFDTPHDAEIKKRNERQRILRRAKWEEATYSFIFEPGQTIDPELVIAHLAELLNVTNRIARKRIIHGKGIILRNIDYKPSVELLRQFSTKGQHILAIREDEALTYRNSTDIISCNFMENGFKCSNEYNEYSFLSSEVFLFAYGGIRTSSESLQCKNVLDIFVQSPHLRIRIWENTFNFKISGIPYHPTSQDNMYHLIKKLTAVAPHAIVCPNIKLILKDHLKEPRQFHSMLEFENYGDWLLFSYFGKDLGKRADILE